VPEQQDKGVVGTIQDRNQLMNSLINENGTTTQTPTPTPAPQPNSFGLMLARLLGLGG